MATSEEMVAKMKANIAEKTGRNYDEWVTIAGRAGYEKHGQIVKFLKSEHGMTHGYANLIAHEALGNLKEKEQPDIIAMQYEKKPALRPIYDAIMAHVSEFGDGLEIAPKKSYVSLRRKKQFAILQPSTKTRFDVGLNMKGVETDERLEAAGKWNSMVSHRVRVTSAEQVDDELIGWLRQAFDQS